MSSLLSHIHSILSPDLFLSESPDNGFEIFDVSELSEESPMTIGHGQSLVFQFLDGSGILKIYFGCHMCQNHLHRSGSTTVVNIPVAGTPAWLLSD